MSAKDIYIVKLPAKAIVGRFSGAGQHIVQPTTVFFPTCRKRGGGKFLIDTIEHSFRPVADHIVLVFAGAVPCHIGGLAGDVVHGKGGRIGTRHGHLLHSHIIQIEVSITASVVGCSLEDENHFLSSVSTEVNGIMFHPISDPREARDKRRFMIQAAVGGDIDGEVTASRILVPKAQLHSRRCRQAERNCFQEVGIAIGISI